MFRRTLITCPASVSVNEIIDRDIGSVTGGARPDQYHRYAWEDTPGDAALPFDGGPQ